LIILTSLAPSPTAKLNIFGFCFLQKLIIYAFCFGDILYHNMVYELIKILPNNPRFYSFNSNFVKLDPDITT